MPIKVNKSDRFGYLPGCWWINRKQARAFCRLSHVDLPRLGHDRSLIGNTFDVFISNIAGKFRLHDERRRIPVEEVEE